MKMDGKLAIGFIADVLYFKGIINAEELEAIYDVKNPSDLQIIVDKMVRGEYFGKRGEGYIFNANG